MHYLVTSRYNTRSPAPEHGIIILTRRKIEIIMSSNPAKNSGDDPGSAQNTGQKTLQVWSEPLKPADEERLQNTNGAAGSSLKISDAVATIKKEDFLNVAQMPCARGGLLTGIASGTVAGGLRFVARGMSN